MNSKRVLKMRMWIGCAALAGWLGFPPLNTAVADPFTLTCAANKTVECGTVWDFDPPLVSGEYVYDTLAFDNATNDLKLRFQTDTTEVGDEITLDGIARHLTSFVFEYYGTNTLLGNQFASPNVRARVRFYKNDGPPSSSGLPRPGTVIFDSGEFGDGASGLRATLRSTVLFDQESLRRGAVVPLAQPLPDTFTWTVQFSGLGANDQAGVDLFSPPVIGSSYADYWERVGLNWVLKTNSASPINFAAQFYAADVDVAVISTTTNRAGFCGENFEATRTWRATNDHSQTSECSQTVIVVDTTPPEITCAPNKAVESGMPWTFDPPTVADECVFSSLVFDNATNDLRFRFNRGTLEIGDEIILDGTARNLNLFVFEYYGSNSVSGYNNFAGNVKARVRFYKNDGPAPNGFATPGTVIYDSDAFPIAPTVRQTLLFDLGMLSTGLVPLTEPLPNTFTWTVQFSDLGTGDEAGVDIYSPAVVGSDYPDYWENNGGWQLKTNATARMDFAAQFHASDVKLTVAVVNTVTNLCGSDYSFTRTWRATDPCGRTNECSQKVVVYDPSLPTNYHAADFRDCRWQIDGTEINRCLSYWRAGGYYLYTNLPPSSDGYAPGFPGPLNPGNTNGTRHTADYQAPFWTLRGTEINRVLAYWRAGCYQASPGASDGYAPGCVPNGIGVGRGFAPSPTQAEPVITHQVASYSVANDMVWITNRIEYTASLLALLWRPLLPATWAITSVAGDGNPELVHGEIVWTGVIPPSPIELAYSIQMPDSSVGTWQIRGQVEYHWDGAVHPAKAHASPDSLFFSAVRLSGLSCLPDGRCRISFLGSAPGVMELQSSTDLIHWTPVAIATNLNGVLDLVDPQPSREGQRFYRAVPVQP